MRREKCINLLRETLADFEANGVADMMRQKRCSELIDYAYSLDLEEFEEYVRNSEELLDATLEETGVKDPLIPIFLFYCLNLKSDDDDDFIQEDEVFEGEDLVELKEWLSRGGKIEKRVAKLMEDNWILSSLSLEALLSIEDPVETE